MEDKIKKYKIDLADGTVFINTDRYGESDLFAYADTVEEVKTILRTEGENFIALGMEFKNMASKFKASLAGEVDY